MEKGAKSPNGSKLHVDEHLFKLYIIQKVFFFFNLNMIMSHGQYYAKYPLSSFFYSFHLCTHRFLFILARLLIF